jgi:hypothetical protein
VEATNINLKHYAKWMDACVCNTSYKFKKHYIWTYHEVPKTHDNEDCVICIECVYIINIIQCTCEINMCTCEFLKTSNFIQKIQNYYFEDMKFELYIYIYIHNRFDWVWML